MGFIIGLPKSKGKDSIFVVMDRLTKYGIFFGIQSEYTSSQVVEVPFWEIHRIHGFRKVLLSVKDPKFIGFFWKMLLNTRGSTIEMSLAYHPKMMDNYK